MTEPTPQDFFKTANVLQDVASRDKSVNSTTGCECCEYTGRVQIDPDSLIYHPCDTCRPDECRIWMEGYEAYNHSPISINQNSSLDSAYKKLMRVTIPPYPDAEVMDAMEEVIRISDRKHHAWDKVKEFIIRAKKKPTPLCKTCNGTGAWGGVDGHLYDCETCTKDKGAI